MSVSPAALTAWLDALGPALRHHREGDRGLVLRSAEGHFALQLSPPTLGHCDELIRAEAAESVGTLARAILTRLLQLTSAAPVGLVCVGPFAPGAELPEPTTPAQRPALAWVENELLYVALSRGSAARLARCAKALQEQLNQGQFAGLVHADHQVDRSDWLVDLARGAYHRARTLKRPRVAHEPTTAMLVGGTEIKQRRHLRTENKSAVSVLAGTQTTPSQARLINVSESGAKLQVNAPLTPGEKVALTFQLPTGPVEATARVVRNVVSHDARQVAVEFDALPNEMADRIAQFVHEAEPEANGRRRHPRRVIESLGVKARVRPAGQRTTNYLSVVDLSEGGFLARSAAGVTPPLEPGLVVDVMLSASGKSFSCRGGVVRRELATDRIVLAVRFLELDREAYRVLRHFLSLVPEATAKRAGGDSGAQRLLRRR